MSGDLPPIALSVRQPWAWAIIHGGKDIENRTLGAIKSGGMEPGRIALHAASGMTEREYRWAVWKLLQINVHVPRPDTLIRGAIIGSVEVVDIVDSSPSPWFGGPWGLVLETPTPCDPVPATGKLGYFRWERSGELAKPRPWMTRYDRPNQDDKTLPLFDTLNPSFADPPEKPWKR